jgi:ApaLI-like restriction endonuclease
MESKPMSVEEAIKVLADRYANVLRQQIAQRQQAMTTDNVTHYLVYRVLGMSEQEGAAIDLYQNAGRFLYKYAGALLEEATVLCFQVRYPGAGRIKIANPLGKRPKTFEVDCLIDGNAYEIKWRDATTDGDHIIKEHERIRAIAAAGYRPVRVMYYYPNREQARKIQAAIAELYRSLGGLYLAAEDAWQHIKDKTGVDLRAILETIALARGV